MKQICVKGMKISNFLFKTEKVTYPMEDTKYLAILPMYKECFATLQKLPNGQYKLIKFLYGPNS